MKSPCMGELFVNFDPQILTLFRETECMSQMGLEVSPFAAALFQKRDVYKKNFSNVKVWSFNFPLFWLAPVSIKKIWWYVTVEG